MFKMGEIYISTEPSWNTDIIKITRAVELLTNGKGDVEYKRLNDGEYGSFHSGSYYAEQLVDVTGLTVILYLIGECK